MFICLQYSTVPGFGAGKRTSGVEAAGKLSRSFLGSGKQTGAGFQQALKS